MCAEDRDRIRAVAVKGAQPVASHHASHGIGLCSLLDRLAQLTGAGVIERHRQPGWPPRVRYVLTSQGQALEPVVRSLWEWGTAQQDALAPNPTY
ncbi:winged helix-turn-helix transcriptional regulator [Streptomyces sp. NPDC052396]|uniref:winged helix-turn-helix transcriptional regulator n=1 Tax=Streptomyces sp. NPDC052396 TaxID=3365689 RepID=UPI0037CE34A2